MDNISVFNGTNNDIEKVAKKLLSKAEEIVGSRKPLNIFLRNVVAALGGEVKIIQDPAVYEEDGGSLLILPDKHFVINLSPSTSPLRDNFTIAHEIGHYVLHYNRDVISDDELVFTRYGSGLIEWQANRFAAAFLMPADEFLKLRKKHNNNAWLISAELEVSQKAVEMRMEYIK